MLMKSTRAFPGVPIYSFEPIPECYERLLLMCEQQPTLHPIQLALSDREGEVDFWLSLYRGSSSIQEMLPTHIEAWPHTEIETKITVPVARLDSVATQLDIKPPVLAKLDIQGHELYAINGGVRHCRAVSASCLSATLRRFIRTSQPSTNCTRRCGLWVFSSMDSSATCVTRALRNCSRRTPSSTSLPIKHNLI